MMGTAAIVAVPFFMETIMTDHDEEHRKLDLARSIALDLVQENGETNADEVYEVLLKQHGIESLGPASGSIFKGNHWVFTGRRVLSKRESNHARELKCWKLKRYQHPSETKDWHGRTIQQMG